MKIKSFLFQNLFFRIRYKNDLKNRQMIAKHKNDLKQLVEKELGIVKRTNEIEKVEGEKESSLDEELEGEILTADNYYRVVEKSKTKKTNYLRTISDSHARAVAAPFIKFIICQFCARIQQGIADDETKKEESRVETEKKQDVSQELVSKREEPTVQEDIQVEKTIFDFFSKSFEPKIENLDGIHIYLFIYYG